MAIFIQSQSIPLGPLTRRGAQRDTTTGCGLGCMLGNNMLLLDVSENDTRVRVGYTF